MINSRTLSDLRSDVAANAQLWLAACRALGLDVEISNTLRDNEYQAYLYAQGRSRPGKIVTNGRTTTFHGAGLAIDFYSQSKGWSEHSFFVRCAEIGKKYGFSWAGEWTGFVEYCHIQWDNRKRSSHRNAPPMPLYKEEIVMTEADIKKLVECSVEKALADRDEMLAAYHMKVAPWASEAWEEANKAGVFDGTRPGAPLARQEAALIYKRLGLIGGAP